MPSAAADHDYCCLFIYCSYIVLKSCKCDLCHAQVLTPLTSQQHSTVPINDLSTPLSINTPIFSGTALLCLRHMPNTPKGMFEGKRRQMVLTVQVRARAPETLQARCCVLPLSTASHSVPDGYTLRHPPNQNHHHSRTHHTKSLTDHPYILAS